MKQVSDEPTYITLQHTPEEEHRFYWVTLPLLITAYQSRTSATVLTTLRVNLTVPLFPKAQMPTIRAFLHQKQISYEQFALMAVQKLIEEGNIIEKVRETAPDAWFDLTLTGSITWPTDFKK